MKRTYLGGAVTQRWEGDPFDCPKDIRCRHFTLLWHDDFSADDKAKAIRDSELVYRAEYHCAGTHRRVFGDDEAENDENDDDGYDTAEDDSDDPEVEPPSNSSQSSDKEPPGARWKRCTGEDSGCVKYDVSQPCVTEAHILTLALIVRNQRQRQNQDACLADWRTPTRRY